MNEKELKIMLKGDKIAREDFNFVFQFLMNCPQERLTKTGKMEKYCDGCVFDAVAIADYFRKTCNHKKKGD